MLTNIRPERIGEFRIDRPPPRDFERARFGDYFQEKIDNAAKASANLDRMSDQLENTSGALAFGAELAAANPLLAGSLGVWDPLESTCRHASLSIL